MTRIREALNRAYDRYYDVPQARARTIVLKEKRADGSQALAHHFEIQETLRPLFGKGEPVRPDIGVHPDFAHLANSYAVEYCPITTMFMDMEGSTRLGLVYPLDKVYRIKNAVIQSTIDIIKSFDGHVHRIMGDAVMAYFGGKSVPPEQGVIDGLNCASVLRALVDKLVVEKFPDLAGEKLGVRIGIDFGAPNKVAWSAYGYPGMEEVTATSFYVDVASKLQHAAGRNQIMVGDSLRSLIDLPERLVSQKTVTKDGEEIPEPFVLPNYAGIDGRPINYRKYVLQWESYLRSTRIAIEEPELFDPVRPPLDVAVYESDAQDSRNLNSGPALARAIWSKGNYLPCSRMLPKGKHLAFLINSGQLAALASGTIKFSVTNHGLEAAAKSDLGHEKEYTIDEWNRAGGIHWEHTSYRGLHWAEVSLISNGKRVGYAKLGIYIE